jgi:hypothetical protein
MRHVLWRTVPAVVMTLWFLGTPAGAQKADPKAGTDKSESGAAMAAAVPGSMIMTGVRATDNLVLDTPRGDLLVRVETNLNGIKVPEGSSRVFMHNPALPLSLQVAIVENLDRLTNAAGRANVIALAGGLVTESQTRFVASAVRMLADYHEKTKPSSAIAAPGPILGRDRDGTLVAPAPCPEVPLCVTKWQGRRLTDRRQRRSHEGVTFIGTAHEPKGQTAFASSVAAHD